MPKFDHSVSMLCWAYNEELLIENFLIQANALLHKTVEEYEIIVIDDCSNDKTNHLIKKLQKSIPEIKLFRNKKNMNVGYSCKRAIKEATKKYLFWQTVDWAYNITLLRTFLELLKKHDVVAGVRYASFNNNNNAIVSISKLLEKKHLTQRSDSTRKALVSVTNYGLIRILFNMPLSDYQNVVFYPTKIVQALDLKTNSSFINPELLLRSYWNGARIAEVPISFIPRTAGEAKGTKIKAIKTSLQDIFNFWCHSKALRNKTTGPYGKVVGLKPDEWEII